MKSKHPDISLEGFGDLTVSVNSDSPKQELEDSLNSHETDIEEKEMNVKEECKEYNCTNEDRCHEDSSEMIELRSMVWHHPVPRKSTMENSMLEKTDEVKSSHEENILVDSSTSQPKLGRKGMKSDFPQVADTELETDSFEQKDAVKKEILDDGSNQGEISAETSASYSGSTCRVNKCKEMKSHFHCHLCDFIAFKVCPVRNRAHFIHSCVTVLLVTYVA